MNLSAALIPSSTVGTELICVHGTGAGEPEEDELYESGVLDSNGVYRLQGDKLVPHEDAWGSIPSVSLLNSKEVTSCVES